MKAFIDITFRFHAFKGHSPSILHQDTPIMHRVIDDEDSSGSTCRRAVGLEPWFVAEVIGNVVPLVTIYHKFEQWLIIVKLKRSPRPSNVRFIGVCRRND